MLADERVVGQQGVRTLSGGSRQGKKTNHSEQQSKVSIDVDNQVNSKEKEQHLEWSWQPSSVHSDSQAIVSSRHELMSSGHELRFPNSQTLLVRADFQAYRIQSGDPPKTP
jgi:hypothetical protein